MSQIRWVGCRPTLAGLQTSMVLVDLFGIGEGTLVEIGLLFHSEQMLQVFVQIALVLFDRQQVIAAFLNNLRGDLGLDANYIGRHRLTTHVQQP